jgi:hypothetical protein
MHGEAGPIIRSIRGFKAYDVVYGADDMVTTGSVLEDHTAADECHRRVMDCIRHHVGPLRLCREFYLCTISGLISLYNPEWPSEGEHG